MLYLLRACKISTLSVSSKVTLENVSLCFSADPSRNSRRNRYGRGRAIGDCPLVNRSQMAMSFSLTNKKMLKWVTKYTQAAVNIPVRPTHVSCMCGKHWHAWESVVLYSSKGAASAQTTAVSIEHCLQ